MVAAYSFRIVYIRLGVTFNKFDSFLATATGRSPQPENRVQIESRG
jgi:hypothetical protein